MKILIAIPCLMRGGTEMQTYSLASALITLGHDVSILCYFEHNEAVVEEFGETGASVLLMKLTRSCGLIALISALRKEFSEINPDIIHVQYMSPGAIPIVAARLAGIKTVFATVHQPYTTCHGILAKLILRSVSMLTKRFYAVSLNAEMSWFGSSSLLDETKSLDSHYTHFTIYNSVDIERIQKIANVDSTVLKKSVGIQTNVPVIGAVSRLSFEKGIDILLDAFRLLVNDGYNGFLFIVGTGPEELKLKDQANDIGILDKVFFFGGTEWEAAMRLMTIMDIVVVPSRYEGFGLTALEAMCLEKPVVASDCGGLKEVVENNTTGLLFEPGNSLSLVIAIRQLLFDPNRIKMGNNGGIRAKNLFSQDSYCLKIRHLLGSI